MQDISMACDMQSLVIMRALHHGLLCIFLSRANMSTFPLIVCVFLVSTCVRLHGFVVQRKWGEQSKVRLSMGVAPYKERRPQNVNGNFFVDRSCIDCDVCRWICPSVFKRVGVQSAVYKQPEGKVETLQALAAMIACPTGSIRTEQPEPLAKKALDIFPAPIDSRIPGVYHLGYHAASTLGAASYLLVRPDGQNVMIDTPRFNSR
ncbi:hypothetical protein EON65_45230 [archaeon]|nr:MAG: hypothetical protein EON65_45230 [archaeon]